MVVASSASDTAHAHATDRGAAYAVFLTGIFVALGLLFCPAPLLHAAGLVAILLYAGTAIGFVYEAVRSPHPFFARVMCTLAAILMVAAALVVRA